MSDERDRELLEQERRKFRMGDDSYQRLEERRDRKRRNRMITSGVLALVIAAAGGTGVVLAFRDTGTEPRPGASSPNPSSSVPAPTPSSSPATSPRAFPPQPSGPIQAVAADEVWYVGLQGEIIHRTGSGNPDIHETGFTIEAVQFVDAQHGWALASEALLRTTDGQTWAEAGEPDQPLRSVQFVTPEIGWGIAAALNPGGPDLPGILVRSTDGGMTWHEAGPTPEHPGSICFVDDSIGWFGAGRSIFRTEDGGQNWSSTTLDLTDNEEPWSAAVACAGDSEAWVLLTDGGAAGHLAYVVFHTGDGTTWQPVAQEAGTSPVGQRGDVYSSQDPYPGQIAPFGPNGAALVTWCPACGNSVTLIKTTDSGKVSATLELAAPDKGGEPQGVSFSDPDHGWVLLTVRTDSGPQAAVVRIVGSDVTVSTGG